MSKRLPYFPHDKLSGTNLDPDLAADVCELAAFFDVDGSFLLSDLRNDVEIGGDEYDNVDAHNRFGNEPLDAAVSVIEHRMKLLGAAYPFELDEVGSELTYSGDLNWARSGYLLSLVLSHLKALSPVLDTANLQPNDADIAQLRNWFQQISAPALAAEMCGGTAWAFGDPRPDHSPFLRKLQQIWAEIKDGTVEATPPPGAPKRVKDDEIDVIAARPHPDGGPGFPIAIAQVATGKDWALKSVRNRVQNVFFHFWFVKGPASQICSYHVIPFIIKADEMYLKTLELGHIIHRLRLARLLASAEQDVAADRIRSEGVDAFEPLSRWLIQYQSGEVQNAA